MRSVRNAILAVVSVAALPARAQFVPKFDFERLTLDPAARGSMVIGTGEVAPAGSFRISLAGHLEHQPFVLWNDGKLMGSGIGHGGTPVGDLVKDRITAHLGLSWAALSRFEIYAKVPFVARQTGDDLGAFGLGKPAELKLATPVLGLRYGLLARDESTGTSLALAVDALLPFGDAAAIAGTDKFAGAPRIEIGHRFSSWLIGAQVGALIRQKAEIRGVPSQQVGSEAQGGIVVATHGSALKAEISARGSYGLDKNLSSKEKPSAEVLAGLRYDLGGFEVFALGGPGFLAAPGTPQYRGIVGIALSGGGAPEPPPPPPVAAPPPLAPPPPPPAVDPCAPGEKHTPEECPDLDDDGDGIPNGRDACPLVTGIPELRGCPAKDGDGDGVPDHLDKCPTEPGPAENQGCPVRKAEITAGKIELKEKVFFHTRKATIQARSYGLLDDVADLLKAHPEVAKVTIEGHTDNRGRAAANRKLSAARSRAVKAYLVNKGVEASRLDTKGYGPDRPAADNKTAAGREANRRVEFTIPSMKR
jgi:outer membrane protein OmpA-like peptidoglycan-associated protein